MKIKNLLLNDKFILWLIVFNALVIFISGFKINHSLALILDVIDNAITLIFIVELYLKISQSGFKNFFQNKWHVFDACIILLAAPSLALWLVHANVINLQFFLVLRLIRLFKFFMALEYFPNFLKFMGGLKHAFKVSLMIIVGFFIYNFIIAIITCFIFKDSVPEYFGTPILAFYSIFKIFTIEGWYSIPDIIAANTGETVGFFVKAFFVIVVFTGGILGLSLVNSIFVDAMLHDDNKNVNKKLDEPDAKINMLIDILNEKEKS